VAFALAFAGNRHEIARQKGRAVGEQKTSDSPRGVASQADLRGGGELFTSAVPPPRFDAAHLAVLTRVLVALVREMSHQVPAPRGMFFHALDHPAGEFSPFERLAARGIFRKYESVLLLGAGLGGGARWCHTHFGCDVTGVDGPAFAAAAAQLSARARLAAHTHFLAADLTALPVREKCFTHVWALENLADVQRGAEPLRQIFRAVRLGGLVALQRSGAPPTWALAARQALASVGFREVEIDVVERPPLRDALRRVRERLLGALRVAPDPLGAETATLLEQTYRSWPAEGGPVTQVFGHRPS
jgi:hypothetical protein